MKRICLLFSLVVLFACDKKKDEPEPSILVVQALTASPWKVTNYTKGQYDRTTDFSNYKFKFNTNMTVDAVNNGTVEKTGTWNADVAAKTITTSFSNASSPLPMLNGTWYIMTSTMTSVSANQMINGEYCVLNLNQL